MKKGLLFDLDGTLIYTGFKHRETIVNKILSEFGKKLASKEEINKFWFEGNREELIKNNFGLDPMEFWKRYNFLDSAEFRKQFSFPYSDVGHILELKNQGFLTGMVTSAPKYIADLEIGMIGKESFDYVIVATTKNGFKPKPNPHGIEECLKGLEIGMRDAIFIGNSDEDVGAAKNAGVYDVLIDRGEYKYENLNPSSTIKSLYELDKVIKSRF